MFLMSCVCVCNVCAFASNIRAGVHFEPSKYYLYLRLKRVSFISVCVCCACELIG